MTTREIPQDFWNELAFEPALVSSDLWRYFPVHKGDPLRVSAGTEGWVETFERLGLWTADGTHERNESWARQLLAAKTPKSRLMAFRLAELWADRHAAPLAEQIRRELLPAFDAQRALDRDALSALSVVAEIATRLASDQGVYRGLEVVLADVSQVGPTADRMIRWLGETRAATNAWDSPQLSYEGRKVPRLVPVPQPNHSKPFAESLARSVGAFFTPILPSLDARHRLWVVEELERAVASLLEPARFYAVRSSRDLTCCGGTLDLARTDDRWVAIHHFAYC